MQIFLEKGKRGKRRKREIKKGNQPEEKKKKNLFLSIFAAKENLFKTPKFSATSNCVTSLANILIFEWFVWGSLSRIYHKYMGL